MLTKSDLKAIGNLIDKKLSTDISAIQARIANIENNRVQKFDLMHIEVLIRSVEKRVAAVEGKLLKSASKDDLKNFATKDDLKKELRGVVQRKDLLAMERRLTKRINRAVDSFDNELMNVKERLESTEQRVGLPTSS